MAIRRDPFLAEFLHRRMLKRWESFSRNAGDMPLALLKKIARREKNLREYMASVSHASEARLTRPQFGRGPIHTSYDAQWSWRPPLLEGANAKRCFCPLTSGEWLMEGVEVFHDSDRPLVSARLDRNRRSADLCAWSLILENWASEASYVSLVTTLPEEGLTGLSQESILRMMLLAEAEAPIDAQLRLSLEAGPNVESIHSNFTLSKGEHSVELDLSGIEMSLRRLGKAWVDLILARPGMNVVRIRDMNFSRLPRAQI